MFRAAFPSSSGAPNCICSLWFLYPCGDRQLSRLGGNYDSHPAWTTAGHHMGIETRGCKYRLELLMMSGMPLETCWVFYKFWNNKLYYKAASFWLFLLIHTAMHGSMNIKSKRSSEIFTKETDWLSFWYLMVEKVLQFELLLDNQWRNATRHTHTHKHIHNYTHTVLNTSTYIFSFGIPFSFVQVMEELRHRPNCSLTPLTRINWDGKPSGYAENLDNWIFLWK